MYKTKSQNDFIYHTKYPKVALYSMGYTKSNERT